MWSYILRRLLYNVPIYLGILLVVMAILRVNDPVYAYLGKNATQEQYDQMKTQMGLDDPFLVQYARYVARVFTFDFGERSWEQKLPVGEMVADAVPPSLLVTVPTLLLTAGLAISIGLVSAYFRGRGLDRALMLLAVVGMSVS